MQEVSRTEAQPASYPLPRARATGAPPPRAASPAAHALALQRLVGNRVAARTLARWSPHPDKEKKGVLVPDGVAAEFLRFNPPKNE